MAHNLAARREHVYVNVEEPTTQPHAETTSAKAKEQPHSSGNAVESFSVLRHKRSRKKPSRRSTGTSTSDDQGQSERERPGARSRRSRSSVDSSRIHSPNGIISQSDSQRLLPDRAVRSPGYGTIGSSAERTVGGTPPRISQRTERLLSVVLFLFVFVLGMTLVICSNIKTDQHGFRIEPRCVNFYAILLISVFLIWWVWDKLRNLIYHYDIGSAEESGSLIPSHLLSGLALFGVVSSAGQVVTILDFVKCRRHLAELDVTYVVYAFFEMAFMFSQMYVFYSLSRYRDRKMLFRNAFTMFTLAVNLTIWVNYFFAGLVNSPEVKDEDWLAHYYYGVSDTDLCSGNRTGTNSRRLHRMRSDLKPFMYTLAMEYSLLASALLLHLWFGIGKKGAGEFGAVKKADWNIWRFGFFLGLLCIPLLGTMAVNATVEANSIRRILIVYLGQLVLFISLLYCSVYGLKLLKSPSFVVDTTERRVDVVLLGFSWIGFVVFDFFTIVATCAEVYKTFDIGMFGLGFTSLVELLTTGFLTVFLATANSRKLRAGLAPENEEDIRPVKSIRQIGSFCVIVSFGFWAMRTYSFRSAYTFDLVGKRFFGAIPWFVITQLSVPFCTFFHFHSAVCFTEVIATATTDDLRRRVAG